MTVQSYCGTARTLATIVVARKGDLSHMMRNNSLQQRVALDAVSHHADDGR